VTQKKIRHGVEMTLLAACALLAACGGGGSGSGGGSEGRLQVINFKYPGGNTLLNGPTVLSATATSGLEVSYRTGTPTTCTVSGNQLTLVAAGECLVIASQAGGAGSDGVKWAAADDVSQLFNVLKKAQEITFTPPDYVLSSATQSITLSATADSGQAVTFETSTPEVCAITGTTLQLKGKGSCAVTAKQAGTDQYGPVTASRFVAVDPLLIADGFAPSGTVKGSSNGVIKTKQNGNVQVVSWNVGFSNWEWCDANPDGDWCYATVSSDGSTLTSAFHSPDDRGAGWYSPFNRIEVFSPGLSGFNQSGDTTQGLQVTTEKAIGFTLGVNPTLLRTAKPIVVHLDLGKRNVAENCNVQLSAVVYPSSLSNGYAIALSDFAVTNNCKLDGINQASLDAVRALPNPNGQPGAKPDEILAAIKAYQDAVAKLPGRDSAAALLKSSTVVRTRFWLMDGNKTEKPSATDIPAPKPEEFKYFASDLTLKGAITIQ
jgi:hypothetical protein